MRKNRLRRSAKRVLVIVCIAALLFAAYAGISAVNLSRLNALSAENVHRVTGELYGGTGRGKTFAVDQDEHPELIEELVGMVLGSAKDYRLYIPFLGTKDLSLTYYDAEGKELLKVYEGNLQNIRIGAAAFRCRHEIDTQIFNSVMRRYGEYPDAE
ncbi:MAG: hypothetical protein IKX47_02350 [Oscillospiraceae bacterium]|nr:hypothetical protein [Oscillospiraceae bacterium]